MSAPSPHGIVFSSSEALLPCWGLQHGFRALWGSLKGRVLRGEGLPRGSLGSLPGSGQATLTFPVGNWSLGWGPEGRQLGALGVLEAGPGAGASAQPHTVDKDKD